MLRLEAAAHVDFGATALEVHFIHQVIDEVDTAAMILVEVLAFGGIWKLPGLEAGAWISNDYEYAAILFENDGALHKLVGVCRASMVDCIGESLTQSCLNLQFFGCGPLAHHGHHGLNQRRDRRDAGGNRHLHLERKTIFRPLGATRSGRSLVGNARLRQIQLQ
jgi:hypothetical protein